MTRAVETGPEARCAMGALGRAHVVAAYSLERMTGQYEALFHRLAAR
jgi:hypothetical protein